MHRTLLMEYLFRFDGHRQVIELPNQCFLAKHIKHAKHEMIGIDNVSIERIFMTWSRGIFYSG